MKRSAISFLIGLMVPCFVMAAFAYQPEEDVGSMIRMNFDESILRDELYSTLSVGIEDAFIKKVPRFILPAEGRVTSRFGWRRDPFHGRGCFHAGVDIANLKMSTIRASSGGVVKFAGRKGGYGNMVVIDHGNGFLTRYCHLKKLVVAKGDKVYQGQPIGGMGDTGRATGSHLHFELRKSGSPVDPLAHLVIGGIKLANNR